MTYQNLDPSAPGNIVIDRLLADPAGTVQRTSRNVCRLLYRDASEVPRRARLALVLEQMLTVGGQEVPGFALPAQGEVHLNARLLAFRPETLYQVEGVLHHEYCHVWQSPGPSWLYEGICDYIRFRAGYFRPTDRPRGGTYQDGYRVTGFFLAWVEEQAPGFVYRLNQRLKTEAFQPGWFLELTGKDVDAWWAEYPGAQ